MGETHTPRTVLLVDGVPGLAFSADGRPMGYVDIDFARMMRTRSSLEKKSKARSPRLD